MLKIGALILMLSVVLLAGCETLNPICSDNFCVEGEIFPKSDLDEDQPYDEAPSTLSESQFLNLLSNGNIQPIDTRITAEQVYDGDTISDVKVLVCKLCDLEVPFPDMIVHNGNVYREVNIRINGIDTPEMKPKKADHETEELRQREKDFAIQARDYLRWLITDAPDVEIRNLQPDKYYGRIVADVFLKINGETLNVAEHMISCGYAVAYDGGTKEKGYWGTAPDPTCIIPDDADIPQKD